MSVFQFFTEKSFPFIFLFLFIPNGHISFKSSQSCLWCCGKADGIFFFNKQIGLKKYLMSEPENTLAFISLFFLVSIM